MVMLAAILAISVCALSVFAWKKWNGRIGRESPATTQATVTADYPSGRILRAMVGNTLASYTDVGGSKWESDHFCSGGTTFSVTGHTILGTEDPALFSSGRRGIFHCSYPVQPETYEVHLLFAETSGLQENSRNVGFSINGGPMTNLDVVDASGGDDIATSKVFTECRTRERRDHSCGLRHSRSVRECD
jgi:hypothetical protein